ncbi:MAG: ATP-binding protein [Caldilineaceae bacterium]
MPQILVIEDETILREEVIEWLTLEGYTTFSAQDGVLGVEIATREHPDLIICDITMPRLDGYGVLLELNTNPATTGIPFIFLTARAAHEDIRLGMTLGADDYITKPFTRLELLEAIQSRLMKKNGQEQRHQQELAELHQALVHEQEQRLLKAKLVAMFSHDFRNPLTSILMANGILRDHSERLAPQRRLTYFNHIEAAARQLVQMLDDVLLIAQMENGKLALQPEQLNINVFLHQILENFQVLQGEKYILLFESQLKEPVWIDARLLQQIVSNLIANAIKYSTPGSQVLISAEQQNGQLHLRVRDHGIGIPSEDQARLFDAFQRGSNVGHIQGTGLGLAITRDAVKLLGGTITVESQVGQGTTFDVRIPLK